MTQAHETAMVDALITRIVALEQENRDLRALVDQAREAYIEDNWDGETDCVTPYDVYF